MHPSAIWQNRSEILRLRLSGTSNLNCRVTTGGCAAEPGAQAPG
ncbi:MAG: hypothetical protein AVDCRST_MAG59-2150 [uncultured Thermomicrobiales bacterium]|uniref:Uncharacterized protein n=1 Tax=uncultured Thermomicrobiales bacterium TaxID=1645740 RepID=A0A6J4URL4_9BACT|nr:MAG: hypothetical protein AVDCRST_MAG59-2150 [uncultured Thermomicrobiales bacterium]